MRIINVNTVGLIFHLRGVCNNFTYSTRSAAFEASNDNKNNKFYLYDNDQFLIAIAL